MANITFNFYCNSPPNEGENCGDDICPDDLEKLSFNFSEHAQIPQIEEMPSNNAAVANRNPSTDLSSCGTTILEVVPMESSSSAEQFSQPDDNFEQAFCANMRAAARGVPQKKSKTHITRQNKVTGNVYVEDIDEEDLVYCEGQETPGHFPSCSEPGPAQNPCAFSPVGLKQEECPEESSFGNVKNILVSHLVSILDERSEQENSMILQNLQSFQQCRRNEILESKGATQ